MPLPSNSFRLILLILLVGYLFLLIYMHQVQYSIDWSIVYRYFGGSLIPCSTTYVLSLPRRTDRHQEMEFLRKSLGLTWSYYDAMDSENDTVQHILARVKAMRDESVLKYYNKTMQQVSEPVVLPFEWPKDIDMTSWTEQVSYTSQAVVTNLSEPITCAINDSTIIPYSPATRPYQVLTPARIACWFSHLSLIQQIANANDDSAIGVILEDDVDMERDIQTRLSEVWKLLPGDWDIVFLGHCWSNESTRPALHAESSFEFLTTRLHPSSSPKCTHAYVLSRNGARRLAAHLTYPPFAYSRAIDQAFAWLVQTGRLNSYSVVPSVVVQRKTGESDVSGGNGSTWKDELIEGVFGSVKTIDDPWL